MVTSSRPRRLILPVEAREGQDWDFTLEIIPNAEQCFNALREREYE